MAREKIDSLEALAAFAERFVKEHPGGGIFGLRGDLGVGKTTFVREVIRILAARSGQPLPRVTSPSYVLHQLYEPTPTVDHFDFYRLEPLTEEGLMEVGYFEAVDRSEQGGYVFVEWPERMPSKRVPSAVLKFEFSATGREVAQISAR